MKLIYLILLNTLFIGVVFGRSRPRPRPPPQILSHEQKLQDDGNFFYNIKTENGISQSEVGDPTVRKGTYKFQTPEGEWVEMTYIADKDGFRVFGSHVPKFNLLVGHPRNTLHRRRGRRRVVRRKVIKIREEDRIKKEVSGVTRPTIRIRGTPMRKLELGTWTEASVFLRRKRVKSEDEDEKNIENEVTVEATPTVKPVDKNIE